MESKQGNEAEPASVPCEANVVEKPNVIENLPRTLNAGGAGGSSSDSSASSDSSDEEGDGKPLPPPASQPKSFFDPFTKTRIFVAGGATGGAAGGGKTPAQMGGQKKRAIRESAKAASSSSDESDASSSGEEEKEEKEEERKQATRARVPLGDCVARYLPLLAVTLSAFPLLVICLSTGAGVSRAESRGRYSPLHLVAFRC